MRPYSYTDFDPGKDFMFVVDVQRENQINFLLSSMTQEPTGLISADAKRQDLLLQRDSCRVRKTVSKEDFDKNMSAFSVKLADSIFNKMERYDAVQKLNVFESKFDMFALRFHKTKKHLSFFETEFKEFLPETSEAEPQKRKDFLSNGSIIFYALVQKFIRLRKMEFSGQVARTRPSGQPASS